MADFVVGRFSCYTTLRDVTPAGPRMCHESLLLGLVLNTPNPAAGLSSVNNVCGDYT